MTIDDRFLGVSEAAEFLHVNRLTLGKICRNGKIAYYKGYGKTCQYKFKKSDLVAFMERQRVETKPQAV